MQLITDQEIAKDHGRPMVIALGSFDGVHQGHQVIIRETVQQAKAMNAMSGVFTFHPHPLKVLAPERAPGLITALSQKRRILSELGVDCLILKAFNLEFATTDFRDFVETYLFKSLKVKGIVIGEDFRFGRGSEGNVQRMEELGQELGFQVTVFDTIQVEGKEVRSTLIRDLIITGQMTRLITYLGRPFSMIGKVTHGDGRGRNLGFPTANLSLAVDYVIPAYGVYAVNVLLGDKQYPGVANIGIRPTFDKRDLSVEIHIMDFSDNLYNQIVEVELMQMVRPERSFASSTELIAQINRDVQQARQILSC